MAQPTTRAEFKEWCLRKLGKPVIEINVDQDQADDRIEEALAYWADYHFDGVEKTYMKHQVTADDVTNKYITIPEESQTNISPFQRKSLVSLTFSRLALAWLLVLGCLTFNINLY
jgi:hypothetical protein